MNTSKLLIFVAVAVIFTAYGSGCNTKNEGGKITMAEGSLSVKNESNVDVFPVVEAKREEDFGGVSSGGFKVIGFAAIDVDNVARVTWAEGEWNASKRTVFFRLTISPQLAQQTKHLEFCYKGNAQWVLNLFSAFPPKPDGFLVAIPGRTY